MHNLSFSMQTTKHWIPPELTFHGGASKKDIQSIPKLCAGDIDEEDDNAEDENVVVDVEGGEDILTVTDIHTQQQVMDLQ